MTEVLSEIVDWAGSKLEYWEKLALYKIMAGDDFDDKTYEELLNHLLMEHDLTEIQCSRPDISFEAFNKKLSGTVSTNTKICEIKNFINVNALVPEQSLPIGPALTVVYGANGSGKTGYARVFGCAGFMRAEPIVFPNINDPDCSNLNPAAEIVIEDDKGKRNISYFPGQECIELNSLNVLDIKSINLHLTKTNKLAFSPAGLSYLTKLSEVTDKVRERLAALVETESKEKDFTTFFQDGDSSFKDLVRNLDSDSNLKAIKKNSEITEEDIIKMSDLDKEIAKLKTKNIPEKIAEIEKTKADIHSLRDKLANLSESLADNVVENIKTGISEFNTAKSISKQLGIDQFKTPFFSQTGTKPWHDFVKAAKVLAEKEQSAGNIYPQGDDRCLFCHQPLSKESRGLIHKLWKFLDDESQLAVKKAELNLNKSKQAIEQIELEFFNEQSVSHRYFENFDKENETNIISIITAFIQQCNKQVDSLKKMIDSKKLDEPLNILPEAGITHIESVINDLDKELENLREADPAEEIKNFENELRILNHKKILNEKYPEIEKYVARLKWAKKASKSSGSTRKISTQYNAMFNKVVSEGYLESFKNILEKFGRPFHVKIVTKPRKGNSYKELLLEADPKSLPPGANLDTVLSEGEKRAVALADFLTEVNLNEGNGGIVLDDPATSFDQEWISIIASILINEAKKRQVIIFTHNLPFICSLTNFSKNQNIDLQMNWIKRGDNDDLPGYVYANNGPGLESNYKSTNIAQNHYKKAKNLPPSEQEIELRQGFGSLRSTYEYFIVYKLLNGVVLRWNERISPGRLKDIVWEKSFFQKVIDKHESLSKYIESHLHSDAYVPVKTTPNDLIKEIECFNRIKKEHKNLKKGVNPFKMLDN